jgi:eukaryotic-like serine/threonine-protein kinase
MNDLAVVYQEQQQHTKAEPLLREALKTGSVKPGPQHALTLKIKNCLATLCHQLNQIEEAEALFTEVLKVRDATLDADHPDRLLSMHNLGVHYRSRRLYDKAEPLLVESATRARTRLTINHPETLRYIDSLAMLHALQGKTHLAEALRRELADVYRKRDGPEAGPYLVQMGKLSQLLMAQKKYAEAEPVIRVCLAVFDKTEPDVWTTYTARAHLGAALLGQKKYRDAEPHLLQGYEGMKAREAQIPQSLRFRLIQSLEWLVQLYEAWDRPDDAARWRAELKASRKLSNGGATLHGFQPDLSWQETRLAERR